MITRAAPTWQLLLADLSLILFIATAGALAHAEEAAQEPSLNGALTHGGLASGSPLAVLRGEGSARDAALLGQWLRDYQPDPREQLTLTLRYRPQDFASAQSRAQALRDRAREAGQVPRIVLEEGATSALHASFAFDHAPEMAR